MRDPERLINHRLFRSSVDRLGFRAARFLIRSMLVPLIARPRELRRLRDRVSGHLRRHVPCLDEKSHAARVQAFMRHWRNKLAEDCLALSMPSLRTLFRTVDDHVRLSGHEHLIRALAHGRGILLAGSHVGSPTLGALFFLVHYGRPRDKAARRIRICVEPGLERYPNLLAHVKSASRDYGLDVGFLFTDRSFRNLAETMQSELEAGAIVATNLDVVTGGGSRLVFPLLGNMRVYLPAVVGAAKTALRSGCVILPWNNLRTRSGFRLGFWEPIGPVPVLGGRASDSHPEVGALCEKLRLVLDGWIAAAPEQWVYWDRLHRRLAENG